MNLAEILQQYYYQTDFVNYVAQFGFPVDYVGPEYHAFFRDKDLVPNAHAHGFKVAPWPVGNDSRDDLRQLFRILFFHLRELFFLRLQPGDFFLHALHTGGKLCLSFLYLCDTRGHCCLICIQFFFLFFQLRFLFFQFRRLLFELTFCCI